MNKEAAFQMLEEQKKKFASRIPTNASRLRTRYLGYVVQEEIEAAGKHLEAIYESHLEVGPDLAPLDEFKANPKYAFWIEGIRRHLQMCDSILAEQPGGA